MERPLCPLCKTNHFAREDHSWPQGGQLSEGTPKIAVEAPRGKFDRVAYQRAYMKAYRARKK